MNSGRRLAGSGMMLTTAAGVLYMAFQDLRFIEWWLVPCAAVLSAAAMGLARKSVIAQVASRAAAWVVLGPTAMITAVTLLASHHVEWGAAAFAAASGSALLLARPMLHTKEARAEFAPARYRKWLLAGATSSVATAVLTGMTGLDSLRYAWSWGGHALGPAVGFIALTLALLASAFGVLRLRTWGVLLGGVTSMGTLLASAILGGPGGLALSLVALPALMFFILPILMARRERHVESQLRVASLDASEHATSDLPSRVRVADFDRDDDHEDLLASANEEPERRAATIA